MWIIIEKIWFAVIVLPALMIHEGYEKLNEFLEKKGWPKVDWFDMALLGLILILIILLLNGYRW